LSNSVLFWGVVELAEFAEFCKAVLQFQIDVVFSDLCRDLVEFTCGLDKIRAAKSNKKRVKPALVHPVCPTVLILFLVLKEKMSPGINLVYFWGLGVHKEFERESKNIAGVIYYGADLERLSRHNGRGYLHQDRLG